MSEFDFDELDRAVSSLMNKQTGGDSPAKPSEVPASLSSDQAGASNETPQPEAPKAEDTKPEQASKPAARSVQQPRGRFMDVVAAPAASTPAAKQPSRTGNTIQPVNRSAASPATSVPARAVDGISQIPAANANRPKPESEAPKSEWPDPIEMDSRPESKPEAVKDQPKSDIDSDDTLDLIDTSDVMSSPFLPDAKVEKRPLGTLPEEPKDDKKESDNENSDELILPAELREDVLSLERDDTAALAASSTTNTESSESADEAKTEQNKPEAVTPEPAKTESSTSQPVEKEEPPANDPAPATALVGALPPRQGIQTTKDDDDAEPVKSIFDTDEHQPINPETKKSSKWFIIAIVGSMLVLGIIGGAIFYLLSNGY